MHSTATIIACTTTATIIIITFRLLLGRETSSSLFYF
jgi:hypothetical protein